MAAHRYWRIYITATAGGGYIELSEVQWRATIGGANIATGGTASASSYNDGGSTAAHAFDATGGTRWATAGGSAAPSWLAYDFGSPVSIAELAVRNAENPPSGNPTGNSPGAFRIEYSDNGADWVDSGFQWSGQTWSAAGETKTYVMVQYTLSGVVLNAAGEGCARLVCAYRRDTGALIGSTTSHATTGVFSISSSYAGECFVVALDDDAGTDYNALIFDRVTPV